MSRSWRLAAAVAWAVVVSACGGSVRERVLPPLSKQIEIREGWLARRQALLPEMMRRHGVAMWIVVSEEFHPDPLAELVAPPRPYVGRRDFFVFVDTGAAGVERFAVASYPEESLARFFVVESGGKPAGEVLADLVGRFDPATIALSIDGDRGVTHSLTRDAFAFLSEALGPKYAARFTSAADLIEEYCNTRLPEERPIYLRLVRLTEDLARRALSNEVIVPGVTTVGEVRRWLYDQLDDAGVTTWFQPDLRVQRRGEKGPMARGFLAVAPESTVIRRGDLVHLDFGVTGMGLNTDWQRMAYVLRPGEKAPPEGLRHALANTNVLQDAVCRLSRPGMTGGEVYRRVMAEMDARGIVAQVYSHPLGNQGHGLGAGIDFRSAKAAVSTRPMPTLRLGSYLAVELNTRTAIPEWDGQDVFAMEEDPAELTAQGWRYFAPRQEALYLVR